MNPSKISLGGFDLTNFFLLIILLDKLFYDLKKSILVVKPLLTLVLCVVHCNVEAQ